MTQSFEVGQVVAVRADRTREGPVIEERPSVGGVARYRVFHARGDVREYAADQLVAVEECAHGSGPDDPITWLNAQELRSRLTAVQLLHPQLDRIYALHAARIRTIPFQFRPLLRLLRSDRPRLLIADDVGVGKTIEAGLILKELQARRDIGNVLVLCPKALTGKWQREMRRFDERFHVLTPETLGHCLLETHRDGAWPAQFDRAIAHYELFRSERFLHGRGRQPGLTSLDLPPSFGLLVADEAHHLRTPGTSSNALVSYLSGLSEAVVLLTATPIQTHRRDLFTLLRLLRPEQFHDQRAFEAMHEPVGALVRAMRLARSSAPGWEREAAGELGRAASTAWGRAVLETDSAFAACRRQLAEAGRDRPLDDMGRVRLLRDLEDLHPLAHVMTRTRRRDIQPFTIREARTVRVDFTLEERALYEQVIALRRQLLLLEHDPIVVRLIIDTLERQAASSLHALAPLLERLLRRNGVRLEELADDEDTEDPEQAMALPPRLACHARNVLELARSLPPEDPKFDRLLELAVETVLDSATPGKVLVFSFFLHTIDYVATRLAERGIRVAVITGRTKDVDRDRLRERFRLDRHDPDAVDVLVSSEVGCEGLDYEFCDRLVNFDLPWNPMRIEQRIGRIDRFGQSAERVLIYNFVVSSTVEERIFHRCFERIGVFTEAVGDLEEILGPLSQGLARLQAEPGLSAEQAEAKARQLADNAVRAAEECRRLDDDSMELLGLDPALAAGPEASPGRSVAPDDLLCLVRSYLARDQTRGRLVARGRGIFELQLNREARAVVAHEARMGPTGRPNPAALRLAAALEAGHPVTLTFDQDTALERREVDFVTPVHPLARLAARAWGGEGTVVGSRVDIDDAALPPGAYTFAIEQWEVLGARREVRLVAEALHGETRQPGRAVAEILLAGPDARSADDPSEPTEALLPLIQERLDRRRRDEVTALAESNESVLNRRIQSLEQSACTTAQRLREELDGATDERIRRMKHGQLRRLEEDTARRRSELEECRDVDIVSRRIAVGVAHVKGQVDGI